MKSTHVARWKNREIVARVIDTLSRSPIDRIERTEVSYAWIMLCKAGRENH